jgi:hypothetical protein
MVMPEHSADWDAVYRYGPSGTGQTDGYWVFAPVHDGDVELFQMGTILAGETAVSFATAVVTASGDVRHLRLPRNSDEEVVRHDGAFRIEVGKYFALSSDAPHEVFRVETSDPEHGVSADLEIRPASGHPWPVAGYRYETTHDSIVEGTITIDGTPHAVSTRAAFEHAVYLPPSDTSERVEMPPFWHYEYVVWEGAGTPFGSLVWNMLDGDDRQVGASSFTTSHPSGRDLTYDAYELTYHEVREFEGRPVPWGWEVSATKGDERFHYRASVRRPLALDARGGGFLADFLLDCEGEYTGPDGETLIRGRGRTENLVISHNPAEKRS